MPCNGVFLWVEDLFFGSFLATTARGGFDFAGFVDDARELFDNQVIAEALGAGNENEGDVGAAEEFFHVLGVAAGVVFVVFFLVVDFDGADGTERTFVAEDEIDGFVFDEAMGFVTTLGADFVAEEGIKADARDDVEFLAEEFV